jgi:hypothetical protein
VIAVCICRTPKKPMNRMMISRTDIARIVFRLTDPGYIVGGTQAERTAEWKY